MRTRAIIALGIGQCVNWGVLYYAFAILLLPLEAALGLPRWAVAGAFSLALLVSAVVAPIVGRWSDRGRAPVVMVAGGIGAVVLLAAWALCPGRAMLYVAWAGLGLCMAATLYEPAFAIVGRAHAVPADRLRALALVTLCGGLASTVFLPTTAWFVRAFDWRIAVVALAVAMGVSAWLTFAATASVRGGASSPAEASAVPPTRTGLRDVPHLRFLLVAFGFTSLAGAAVIANLVPAAVERRLTPTLAASLGGTFGVMQLPGRVFMMRGGASGSPFGLLAASLALQAVGLAAWALAPGVAAAMAGLMTFALGAGLSTLVRPFLVQTVLAAYGPAYVNGRVAQAQQVARAGGPVLIAWAAHYVSYAGLLTLLAGVYAVLATVALVRKVEPAS
jgi:MFS family permease